MSIDASTATPADGTDVDGGVAGGAVLGDVVVVSDPQDASNTTATNSIPTRHFDAPTGRSSPIGAADQGVRTTRPGMPPPDFAVNASLASASG